MIQISFIEKSLLCGLNVVWLLCSPLLLQVRVEALAVGFTFVLPLKVLSGDKRLESASYGYVSHTQEPFQDFHVYLCL